MRTIFCVVTHFPAFGIRLGLSVVIAKVSSSFVGVSRFSRGFLAGAGRHVGTATARQPIRAKLARRHALVLKFPQATAAPCREKAHNKSTAQNGRRRKHSKRLRAQPRAKCGCRCNGHLSYGAARRRSDLQATCAAPTGPYPSFSHRPPLAVFSLVETNN